MNQPVLGIIGGGQLGSMLSEAAKKVDIKTVVLSDDPDAPAKNFTNKFIYGNYGDSKIITEFVDSVDLVTYEFENIPFDILNEINKSKSVLPKPEINSLSDINEGIDFTKEYILEKFINLKKEISIVICRFGNQKYEIYEPIENVHEDQILKHSKIPAEVSETIKVKSKEWAKQIVEELDYIGTLCVEFFIDKNENLYVNEIAPRVHNSGHLTINSHNVSQFENHIRAVCGLKKIDTKKIYNAQMINLIGDDITIYRNKTFKENEFFYDYLKKQIKAKRKMGHLTIIEK